jgi:hypothetical protein
VLPEEERGRAACKAFLEWDAEHHVRYLETEFRIYSRKYHYAGTSDLDMEIDGERSIVDIKTSNASWPEMGMQLAAYQNAREEESPFPGVRRYGTRWIIRCGKDGGMEFRPFTDYESDLKGFLAALELSRWQSRARG